MFLNGWETITSLFYCFALLYNNNHGWHCLCSVCWFLYKEETSAPMHIHKSRVVYFICILYISIFYFAHALSMWIKKRSLTKNICKMKTQNHCWLFICFCSMYAGCGFEKISLEYVFSICVIPLCIYNILNALNFQFPFRLLIT